jgi:hypothetical protein
MQLTAAGHHQILDPRAHDTRPNNLARFKTQEQRCQTLRLMKDNGLYSIHRKPLPGLDVNHLDGHWKSSPSFMFHLITKVEEEGTAQSQTWSE